MDDINLQWDLGDEISGRLDFDLNVQQGEDAEPGVASEQEGGDTGTTLSVLYDLDAAAFPGWHGLEASSVSENRSVSALSGVESSISLTAESAEDEQLDTVVIPEWQGLEASSVSEILPASARSDVESNISLTAESAEDEHLDAAVIPNGKG
ncbi:uncharacterized protein [Palaemon carinicauda]|uniref:uncharacterized protein n=1 Tax=Palaemon carinicauda TaxID=392227 RepID=UPI0035B57536